MWIRPGGWQKIFCASPLFSDHFRVIHLQLSQQLMSIGQRSLLLLFRQLVKSKSCWHAMPRSPPALVTTATPAVCLSPPAPSILVQQQLTAPGIHLLAQIAKRVVQQRFAIGPEAFQVREDVLAEAIKILEIEGIANTSLEMVAERVSCPTSFCSALKVSSSSS
jgi:hypothetical protein